MQMAVLNMTDVASNINVPYGHRMEQQQSLSFLPVKEKYKSSVAGFTQRIRPIARRHCNIASRDTYYKYLNVANAYGTLLRQQHPRLPYQNTVGQIASAVTNDSSNTAYSAGHSSGTNIGLTLSLDLHLPTTHSPQPSHPLPGPVPLACPERQDIDVTPSRVNNSPFHVSSI
jgi:hypothetical protein